MLTPHAHAPLQYVREFSRIDAMVQNIDGLALIQPAAYAASGTPHALWTQLLRESPVHRFALDGYDPFWSITRHADICHISKRPEIFKSAPGIVVVDEDQKRQRASGEGLAQMRTIIEMDPPEHRAYRKVASPWFTPRAVKRVSDAVDASARHLVDGLAAKSVQGEGECDFATDVAAMHPLRILSTILGLSQEEEPRILELTNQLFAADDPELGIEQENREQGFLELGLQLFQLFEKIIADRKQNPRDDLASLLANGLVDGQPMGPMETFGYYLITFTAGHDTTKNALVGGMRALLEHPDQLERLKREPDLIPSAVEEIVRWTSPVNYMKRTAEVDTEVGGVKIGAGDELVMFYASANRDEDVFEDPFSFRVDRDPNPHLGFGIGEHFCLGANLARQSQVALFRELVGRLEHAELAGEPEQIASSFVVGLKHLPMRYRIRPS
jgi:cytochrome P450